MTNLKENNTGHGLSLNTIYNMDCIEGMRLIPDGSIDCIITDPPFGTTACKRDNVIPFEPMREQLKRIIKPNGAIVLFGSEPFSSALRMSNIKQYKYDWIWDKIKPTGMLNDSHQPLRRNEIISIFYGKKCTYNPQKILNPKGDTRKGGKCTEKINAGGSTVGSIKEHKYSELYESNKLLPTTIIQFSKPNKPVHPTQKPIALIEYLIKTYTNEGETVLDFTIGSGTTAIAAINTNRNYIGFELDEGYFDIANKRIEDITISLFH